MPVSTTFPRLVLEELRALPRGRFALPGLALLLALYTALAALVGAGAGRMDDFLVFAYVILPSALAPWVAAQVAGVRATGWAASLYTTPVREGSVLLAKLAASALAGLALLAVPLPFLGVAAFHVGAEPHLAQHVAAGAGVVAFGACLGAALGVLFAGRTLTAPVSVAAAFVGLSLLTVPFALDVNFEASEPDPLAARAVRASPHVLLVDAFGLAQPRYGIASEAPGAALATFAIECLALLALAAWAYTREQSPEGWEAGPRRRAAFAIAAVAVLALPVVAGSPGYEAVERDEVAGRGAHTIGRGALAVLVPPGTPARETSFDGRTSDAAAALRMGEPNRVDLLVALYEAPPGKPLADVEVQLAPLAGVDLAPPHARSFARVPAPEVGRAGSGAAAWSGSVLRVPVEVTPGGAGDLSGSAFHLRVNVTFRVEGEPVARHAEVEFSFRADVPHAKLQMALAGLPLVALATTAAARRRATVG